MPNLALLDLLARQDGLVTHAQSLDCGISESTLQRRVRSGEWDRLAPRTYLVGGHPLTDAARVRAVGLWAGPDAAVCGPAAAWWHGMRTDPPDDVDLTVPRSRNPAGRPGVRVRRRDLRRTDRMRSRGVWLTAKPLTALETAIAVPDGSVFLDRALQKHVRFPRAYEAYCRNMGAAGSAAIAQLLTAAADRADSAAERLMLALLRGAGLTGWVRALPFQRWTVDFAFPSAKIAIEVDGWAWHMDVDRFRADRHKGNALVRDRWDLLRFTWHDLNNRPDYVIGEIRAALATAALVA
jgi:very-short-patch-repair endonuclease